MGVQMNDYPTYEQALAQLMQNAPQNPAAPVGQQPAAQDMNPWRLPASRQNPGVNFIDLDNPRGLYLR